MKSKPIIITLISLLSLIIISLIVLLVLMLNGKFKFRFNYKVSDKLVFDKVYDNDYTDININTKAAIIYIKNSEDNNYKVLVYGKEEYTKVVEKDNMINIETNDKKCNFFCFNRNISKVEVYVPKEYEGNINIENDYGDIKIDSIANAKLNASLDAGDLEIDEVSSLKAKLDYGDIKIENVNNDFDLELDYGDIKISNLNIKRNSYAKTDLGDIKIGKTNEVYIDAKTDLGDVKIDNNYRKSEITLKLETDMGDIKVNN